jgi:hypothetical protein
MRENSGNSWPPPFGGGFFIQFRIQILRFRRLNSCQNSKVNLYMSEIQGFKNRYFSMAHQLF